MVGDGAFRVSAAEPGLARSVDGPTIDSIDAAEFESHAALREGLSQKAPGLCAVRPHFSAR
jgi:hypothetical protein